MTIPLTTELTGALFIAGQRVARASSFHGIVASTGELMSPAFSSATADDIAAACLAADAAFETFANSAPRQRAALLHLIADHLEALRAPIIARAMLESGLPEVRLNGELSRTTGQLKHFAGVLEAGHFAGVRIDPAQPDRAPLPKPDLRLRYVSVGPVAVFGASNFPLAFSVAGGDTASALAAGCPVVVKGHPAHPGTSELVASAITAAVAESGFPAGIFSLLNGTENSLGAGLITDPRIKAVGFTGSRAGGLALLRLAQARAEPIPVYAEMSSVNPVYLLPHKLEAQAEALGAAFVGSLTMGVGQFCTNPGLILGLESEALSRFIASASAALEKAAPGTMLTKGICSAYQNGVAALQASPAITVAAHGQSTEGATQAQAVLMVVAAQDFMADGKLGHEVFGPASVVVVCKTVEELMAVTQGLEGQLTATLHLDAEDHALARELIPHLERRVGRILANGWPTGVEVTHAMVHGGPFPATSDVRSTSVGATAIDRFLRPISYQSLADDLLPAALQEANPFALPRLINGKFA